MNDNGNMEVSLSKPFKSGTKILRSVARTGATHRHAAVIIIFPSPTHAKQGIISRVYGNDAKCTLNICFCQVATLTSRPN